MHKEAIHHLDENLLHAVAQQIKNPMVHVARLAELAHESEHLEDVRRAIRSIETSAEAALRLVDSFLYSTDLQNGQTKLNVEPIAISVVLEEVAHRLNPVALQHGCSLQVNISGSSMPVVSDKRGLTEALTSLGLVCMEGQPQEEGRASVLVLAAHRNTRHENIVAGIFGLQPSLTQSTLTRARLLYGRAHQPLPGMGASSGGGLFVADSILASIHHTSLRIAKHRNLTGLAACLPPSRQLALV